MKKSTFLSFGLILFALITISQTSIAQTRLPDGTIIYQDGSRRLPNGSIVYPNNTTRTTGNRTIDGILHPNRTTTVTRYPRRNYDYNRNRNWMPPGQAKKVYGGSARDYAPGHNKGRDWNDNDRRDRGDREDRGDRGERGGHGNGRGHGRDK